MTNDKHPITTASRSLYMHLEAAEALGDHPHLVALRPAEIRALMRSVYVEQGVRGYLVPAEPISECDHQAGTIDVDCGPCWYRSLLMLAASTDAEVEAAFYRAQHRATGQAEDKG